MDRANAICTVCSADYLPLTRTLFDSIRRFQPELACYVLISDREQFESEELKEAGIACFGLSDVTAVDGFQSLYERYGHSHPDEFRWSLKSVFMRFLLQNEAIERLVYADNDICFFASIEFIFDSLQSCSLLLSPHWRSMNPKYRPRQFNIDFRDGQFNAGFVGVNRDALPALEWWTRACVHACRKSPKEGLWDDQRYLDVLLYRFEGTAVLRHQGCNLAAWNMDESGRSSVNGQVLIDGQWPVVFIHFTTQTIRAIAGSEQDALLKAHLVDYGQLLAKYGLEARIAAADGPGWAERIGWEIRYKLTLLKYGRNPFKQFRRQYGADYLSDE